MLRAISNRGHYLWVRIQLIKKSFNIFEVSRKIFWYGVSPPETILKSIDSQENNMEHWRSSGAGQWSRFCSLHFPSPGILEHNDHFRAFLTRWNLEALSVPGTANETQTASVGRAGDLAKILSFFGDASLFPKNRCLQGLQDIAEKIPVQHLGARIEVPP